MGLHQGEHGWTPLKVSSFIKLKIIAILLDNGAEIEQKDKCGRTALMWVTRKDSFYKF